jgi:signal peptidase I
VYSTTRWRTKTLPTIPRRLRLLGALVGVGLATLGTLVGALLAQRRVTVRGQSMRPVLRDGERVLVNRLAYRLAQPRRGDVALVRGMSATAGPGLLLKRIVGLPGETVAVERDCLWIDGEILDLGRPVVGSSPGRWALSDQDYFLLSENLAIGTDSRHTGPSRRADLLGRAWLVYAPTVRRVGNRQSAVGSER